MINIRLVPIQYLEPAPDKELAKPIKVGDLFKAPNAALATAP